MTKRAMISAMLSTSAVVALLCCTGAWVWVTFISAPNVGWWHYLYLLSPIVIALAAVVFGLLAVLMTAKVSESVYVQSFTKDYFSSEMKKSIERLGGLKRQWNCSSVTSCTARCVRPIFQERSPKKWKFGPLPIGNRWKVRKLRDKKIAEVYSWSEEDDNARRMLKGYFVNLYLLYEAGALSKEVLILLCDKDSLPLLFQVVEPMESILNKRYKWQPFKGLMKIMVDKYDKIMKNSIGNKPTFVC